MMFRHIASAYGREVFVTGAPDEGDTTAPQGFSIAAVVLREQWKSDELGSLLNELYGALADWTEFDASAGARSFVFFGERADEASSLCDAFAYAWTKGAEDQYNDVIASSNDSPDLEVFVEAMFSGEIAVSDTYANKLRNLLFAVLPADANDQGEVDPLVERVTQTVTAAVQQHRFD